MSQLHNIENQIVKLTSLIETKYPELYQFLEETPVTMPAVNHPDINTKIMKDYLESLKQLLKHHIETHKSK
ncbi:hypothetical protein [Algibacter sp. R77976]|uniref:hypothetical protein n=1 Tax=Algibacter sp. R77976 TaxID=3093873 RepID=UPI0037C6B521